MANAFGALWRYQRAQLSGVALAPSVTAQGHAMDLPIPGGPGEAPPVGRPAKDAGQTHA
jgi:hypothetical protein